MAAASVTVYDVGPRDGLQNEPELLDVATRAELVRRLAGARLPAIEVASFVDPRRVPQMAHAEEVVAAAGDLPDVVRAGLTLNERGYERLVATGLDEVRFAFGVTESFNLRNQGVSVEESVSAATRIVERARGRPARHRDAQRRVRLPVRGRGRARSRRRGRRARRREPTGRRRPRRHDRRGRARRRTLARRTRRRARHSVGGHFHNTRNTGYANALVAIDAGATVLDASVGGVGGCPFAPNATGNIATEDLVYALEREGIETGIDFDALVGVARWLAATLGRRLDGQLYRAGSFPS